MSKYLNFLFLVAGITILGCEDGTNSQTGTAGQDTTAQSAQPAQDSQNITREIKRPDCEITGSVLDGNTFWAKPENLLVVIAAEKETEDPEMGESHRVLEIYDGNTCEVVLRKTLPVNVSPDFPYYLSEITYNNLSKVVAVRGVDKIYIVDLANKVVSTGVRPAFLNERFSEDAQSGMIQRLEIWEDYLVGYAEGEGAFVFDLKNAMEPKPVLPTAEYEISEGTDYNSMFLLASGSDEMARQAILPTNDPDSGEFEINPLFEKPLVVNPQLNPSFRDNRFIVLHERKGGDKKAIGIDMKKGILLDLPLDLANKKDTEIIAWMKQQ